MDQQHHSEMYNRIFEIRFLVKFVYEIKFTRREATTNQQTIAKHLVWAT